MTFHPEATRYRTRPIISDRAVFWFCMAAAAISLCFGVTI